MTVTIADAKDHSRVLHDDDVRAYVRYAEVCHFCHSPLSALLWVLPWRGWLAGSQRPACGSHSKNAMGFGFGD